MNPTEIDFNDELRRSVMDELNSLRALVKYAVEPGIERSRIVSRIDTLWGELGTAPLDRKFERLVTDRVRMNARHREEGIAFAASEDDVHYYIEGSEDLEDG